MAKEFKTTQLYPNDNLINDNIELWGNFGWELVSNQRCQEQDGEMLRTFNKLTFSREKTEKWHEEVSKLEKEYDIIIAQAQKLNDKYKKNGWTFSFLGFIILTCLGIIPGMIYVIKCLTDKKYCKAKEEAEPKIRDLEKQADEIAKKADKIVNAR